MAPSPLKASRAMEEKCIKETCISFTIEWVLALENSVDEVPGPVMAPSVVWVLFSTAGRTASPGCSRALSNHRIPACFLICSFSPWDHRASKQTAWHHSRSGEKRVESSFMISLLLHAPCWSEGHVEDETSICLKRSCSLRHSTHSGLPLCHWHSSLVIRLLLQWVEPISTYL